MMKTKFQRTKLLRAARALSTPKCTATMFLVALLTILTYPTQTWAQEPIAKIGDTPYESLQDAFDAAADGSTVTLLANVDLGNGDINIRADKGERNLTFDMNGFSLTSTLFVFDVNYGVNITVKGGTIGGPDADNICEIAIHNKGGKVNIEDLTISNCRDGIHNERSWQETTVPGELTIGSGVNISATGRCIDHSEGKLTLTALPILSWGEADYGIMLREGYVINFAGEGITALPEGFKPIMIGAGVLPCIITDGYADHVKSGSEVIDPDKVFVGYDNGISMILYDGEAMMTYGSIQKVSVTKGNEVKQYLSLYTAFNEAADGSTITLLDNADLGEDLIEIWTNEGERNLTFDLNGFSLTRTGELLYVRSGVNLTVKGGTVGGPDADNVCYDAIRNIGGKVNIEDLTISNCEYGILNDEGTTVAGELTIGSGVKISATKTCIDNINGILTFTALPILSWGEEGYGFTLGKDKVINFAGEGIAALPEGFKPIKIYEYDELPCVITNGYADHVKSGSEVIDPAKVFDGRNDDISLVIYDGEAMMTYGGIQKVCVTKGNEVKEYFSLQTALNEAADGSTVTLLDNADLGNADIHIRADEGERNLTFDLSGFSLTGKDQLLNVHSGVNLTVKGGTVGGVDADNHYYVAICNLGGKLNIENLAIINCKYGIYNGEDRIDEETTVAGELTIGSGVIINATAVCIDHYYKGKLTFTALPILSWGEDGCGITLEEENVIHFAGEGITALPEGFKPIMISTYGKFPRVITNGYADHVKSGSEVIDPAKVFVGYYDGISIVLYDGEAMITYGGIQKVSVTKGDEVKEYLSLQSAFDEAADGSTITLLDDADLGEYVIDIIADEGERNLTFDLNNFSLTGAEALLYVHSGVNLTVKGGTVGGPDADNVCYDAICNFGGKVNIENLTISNCEYGIYNGEDWIDEETSVPGEMTIGSGVNISATAVCIEHFEGKLTLTALPIQSWGEKDYGIVLGEGQAINFAGEGITALPEGFKPIKIITLGELPHVITNGYSTFFKNIDPADVFIGFVFVYDEEKGKGDTNLVSITLEGGEVSATSIVKHDVNVDGRIDVADVVALTNAINDGTTDLKYDISGDNQVNRDDITALVNFILGRNDDE